MTQLSKKIFEEYQVRKTKKQKYNFINLMRKYYPNLKIEEKGKILNTQNLIIGDLEQAKLVLTAHYDTCAVMPIPNFLTPKNAFIFILYQMAIVLIMILISSAVQAIIMLLMGEEIGLFAGVAVLLLFAYLMIFGKANKHTANDNTSGVITLIEIMEAMSDEQREKTAFVFFDLEEAGLIGSSRFKKAHKNMMKDKLLINFDCVSDGDYIMLVETEPAQKEYGELIRKSFNDKEGKIALFEKSSTTIYPSDQANFKKSIAVASFKKSKIFGYYMDKIHTNKDCNFDEKNIKYISECIRDFTCKIQ